MIIGISGKIGSGKDTVGKIIQYLTSDDCSKSCLGLLKLGDDIKGYHNSNWKVKKFAYKLKQIVAILTGCTIEDLENQEFKNNKLPDEWIRYGYADGFFKYFNNGKEETKMNNVQCNKERYELEFRTNWQTAYKIHPTYREVLQYFGTELFRDKFHSETWVNALFADYKKETNLPEIRRGRQTALAAQNLIESAIFNADYPNWIITDMRFPNELKAIKDRDGITIRINRRCEVCKLTKDERRGKLCYEITCSNGRPEHESETALDNVEFDYIIDNNGTIEELIFKVKDILIQEKIIK